MASTSPFVRSRKHAATRPVSRTPTASLATTAALMALAAPVMAPFDPEMAALVQARLEAGGVHVLLGHSVSEVSPSGVALGMRCTGDPTAATVPVDNVIGTVR